MSKAKLTPDDAEPEVITTTAAPGWWVLLQRARDDAPWRRVPLACWALVADAQGGPFVVAMTVGHEGQSVTFAPPGTYVHAEQWMRCTCRTPVHEVVDPAFCTACGSLAPVAA